MAGKFPLAFSTASDYGANDPSENQYFHIHNVSNTSVFADPNANPVFDVYTFAEAPGDSDTPHSSFALVIIKNMGSSQSHLEINNIQIESQGAFTSGLTAATNPFSFVTSNEGIDVDVQSNFDIITTSAFSALQSGSNNEAPNGAGFGPWGYLKINEPIANPQGSIEAETGADGSQTSTDFAAAGAGVLYIPLYDPENTSSSAGLINHGDDNRRIGAKLINGVTYPEYGAFLIHCNPVGEMDGHANLLINFSTPTNVTVNFQLPIVAYRRGDLEYQQGRWNSVTGTFVTATSYGDKAINDKVAEEEVINYQTVQNGSFSNNFPLQQTGNLADEIMPPYESTNSLRADVMANMMPLGYLTSLQGHLDSDNSQINNSQIWIKANDSTSFTGGVRFLKPGYETVLKSDQANTDKHLFGTAPSDYTLKYYTEPPHDGNASGAEITTDTRKLDTGEVIYAVVELGDQHNKMYYAYSLNSGAFYFHPNANNLYLDPDTGAALSQYNRKVRLYGIPFFHNPFFINETAANLQEHGEQTHKDTLFLAVGDYRIWSTSPLAASKYCRIASIGNLANPCPATAFSADGVANDRFGDVVITENVAGIQLHPLSSTLYKEQTMTSSQNKATSPNYVDTANQKITQWVHKHIYDLFMLPNELGQTTILPSIETQYNNISGYDAFYCDQFNFTEDSINNIVNIFTSDGEVSVAERTPIELTQENPFTKHGGETTVDFKPGGVKDVTNTNTVTPSDVPILFSKAYTTTVPWTTLSDADQLYPGGAKAKRVNLQIRYEPEEVNFMVTPKWDGINDIAPTDYADVYFDALGRIKQPASLILREGSNNLTMGTGSVTKRFTGNLADNHLTYHFYGKSFLPRWKGFKVEASVHGDCWTTPSNLYVTNYGGEDLFGESSPSGTTRANYTSVHLAEAKQKTGATHVSSSNSDHGMSDGLKGIKYEFARGASHPTDNYFYRKYPLNGQCTFKYEDYFQGPFILDNRTSGAGAGGGAYIQGIIPGPLAEGRFTGSGNPQHHVGVSSADVKNTYLRATADTLDLATGRYEVIIPFNFSNNNHQNAHLVSVTLENYVGSMVTNYGGQAGAAGDITYGDPRAIRGGDLTIASDGTIGNKYEIPLSPNDFTNSFVAPAPLIQGSAATDYYAEVEFASTTTTATTPTGGTAGMVSGMKVYQKDGGDDKIPAGTTITVVNETTLNFNQSLNAAANGATFDVYLDWPMNDYICWDIVEDADTGTPGQYKKYQTGNAIQSVNSSLDTFNDKYHPDAKSYDNTFIADNGSGTVNYKTKGKMDASLVTTPHLGSANDGTFYGHIEGQSAKPPLIYFALDNNINVTDNPSANTNNELDEGEFFNRLKIRYVVHEKLERYGARHADITGSAIDGSNTNDIEGLHVLEDTYIVKVTYINKTAEAVVTDLEGNAVSNFGSIDFGTLQAE